MHYYTFLVDTIFACQIAMRSLSIAARKILHQSGSHKYDLTINNVYMV